MKRGQENKGGAGIVVLLLLLCALLVPSSGAKFAVSDMIASKPISPGAETPSPAIESAPVSQPTIPPTAAPSIPATVAPSIPATVVPSIPATAAPSVPATAAPTIYPTISPSVAPIAQAIDPLPSQPIASAEKGDSLRAVGEAFDRKGDGSVRSALSMDDFSAGAPPAANGYDSRGQSYQDDTISVTVYQERIDYTIYTVAEVTIADPSQLRTAIAGTPGSPARAKMTKLAGRVNAIVAIDGDYYADRKGAYAVRQKTVLSDSFASDLDLLVIDIYGDFHCLLASEKREALPALMEDMYQCLCFGPVLIRDGEKLEIPEKYQFGATYLNPRAGIGQLGELEYLLVVASGRIDNSMSITVETLRDYMFEKGCVQAYNVDGGASAELYFNGESASPLTDSGERGLYDILYFASAAKGE